jgi:hypothetical protein
VCVPGHVHMPCRDTEIGSTLLSNQESTFPFLGNHDYLNIMGLFKDLIAF